MSSLSDYLLAKFLIAERLWWKGSLFRGHVSSRKARACKNKSDNLEIIIHKQHSALPFIAFYPIAKAYIPIRAVSLRNGLEKKKKKGSAVDIKNPLNIFIKEVLFDLQNLDA